MAQPRTRQAGGAHTAFTWRGKIIGMAEEIRVGLPRPVAQAEVIQPLNARRPLEIVTADAMGAGTITLVLKELYGYEVWQYLEGLAGSNDLADIMSTVKSLNDEGGIKIQKIIYPNPGVAPDMFQTFLNCVISDVGDDEPVRINTMSVNREITVMYTHSIRQWINPNATAGPTYGVPPTAPVAPNFGPR